MAPQPNFGALVTGDTSELRRHFQGVFRSIQTDYCAALERFEPQTTFSTDEWSRSEGEVIKKGFGVTRILRNGEVFDQAVVALSSVSGILPTAMSEKLIGTAEPAPFCADGVSLIVHPRSPLVPTTHANVRLLSVGGKTWFGGGADLTPSYLFEEDAVSFHRQLSHFCEESRLGWYQPFKKWCDEYFYLPHRGEARGIGGIFYDYLGRDSLEDLLDGAALTERLGRGLASCYTPIVERRKELPWSDAQRTFQEIRRGRYVEFNLLYDRGTQFGLQSGGRVESILASLPPRVQWSYGFAPEPGSAEDVLIKTLQTPREWLSETDSESLRS